MSKNRTLDIERFCNIFKALSNPNRLKIFLQLVSSCKAGHVHVVTQNVCRHIGELGEDLGISPSTMSHHIKELRRSGLINIKRKGQKIECWIDPDVIMELEGFFKLSNGG